MQSMDLDEATPMVRAVGEHTNATILCYNCGAPIDGSKSSEARCYDCIKLTTDITRDIPREANIQFCRDCNRWMVPPSQWVRAEYESRDMLALCLKRIKGLNKLHIVDAKFIWTEPNSRRVRLNLTVQDSVTEGVILTQSFEVMFVVSTHQCPECAKSFTHHAWSSTVQVRQKVTHKRTFLFMEQLLIKHNALRDTLTVKTVKEGVDFYFGTRGHAIKFVDFLKSVVPITVKNSPELISEDSHSGSKTMKFAFSVTLVPICKDDLVALPIPLAKKIGNIFPLTLCHRVGTSISLVDPVTLQTAEIPAPVYWHEKIQFQSLLNATDMVEFVVLDIESTGTRKGRWVTAEATVARANDLGNNDKTYFTRTHLGLSLQPGDSAMGYLLDGTVFNSYQMDQIEKSSTYSSAIPEVVLVKKHYPNRKRNRRRNWKLKRMAQEESEMLPRKQDQEQMDKDYEMFLRDVEEDDELRAALALYKNPSQKPAADAARSNRAAASGGMDVDETDGDDGDDDDDDDAPKVSMDELLDDLDDLDINDAE